MKAKDVGLVTLCDAILVKLSVLLDLRYNPTIWSKAIVLDL